MTTTYWIKMYTEILHDPKMGQMSEHLWKRTMEMFLLAGCENREGALPSLSDMAWTLRTDVEQLETDLIELQHIGILIFDNGWIVRKFAERQAPSDPTAAERMRRYRERQASVPTNDSITNEEVFKRDNNKCVYCGKSGDIVEHMVPTSRGGTGDADNYAVSCRSCNSTKRNRTPEEAGMPILSANARDRHARYLAKLRVAGIGLLRVESETDTETDIDAEGKKSVQDLLETIVGLPLSPSDIEGINELKRLHIIEQDIRGALQWRKENNHPPVKRLSQLFAGIKVEYSKRVQGNNARGNSKLIPLNETVDQRIAREVAEAERTR